MEPLVEAFGYSNVRVEGYEADDVIASLAERALHASPPVPVMIVTGDRDAFQLIDEAGLVKVMATARGITDTKIYDRQAVIDRYGIAPEMIPDFYGLKGDSSDNIPGVPGIGDKTASELIQSFGSLEDVLAHIDDIKGPKRKENLLQHAENARLSKSLATVQRDVAVEFDIAAESERAPDRSRVREVFREYELRDPLRRLEEALAREDLEPAAAAADELRLTARARSGSPADIAHLAGPESELCVVVQASEPAEGELFAQGPEWRFAVAADGEVLVGECSGPKEISLACGERPVLAHDAKSLDVVPRTLVHDTLLGAYLLEPARRGYPFAELCEERGIYAELKDPLAGDAVMLGALADWQREQIAERGLSSLMEEIELPLVSVLRDMEVLGVRLNLERLAEITGRVHAEIDELEREIFTLSGEEFLISSPQQLGEILFEKLGLSRKRRGKTGYSTDARVLQSIRSEHEIVPKIERWRELSTLIKTYLDVLPQLVDERSRIHTTFLQAVAQTGRLSSNQPEHAERPHKDPARARDPPLHRRGAGQCVLVSADYSQIELRVLAQIAAHEAGPQADLRAPARTSTPPPPRQCLLRSTPRRSIAGMRSKAKMINYGIAYGLTDYGLADRLHIPQRGGGGSSSTTYLERFPQGPRAFIDEHDRAGHRPTATSRPCSGRRRPIPELRARNSPGAAGARRAPRRQHRDPGHRRRHHQARDGAACAKALRRVRPQHPPAPPRSTTSC
jgi:DNA polymerase-1